MMEERNLTYGAVEERVAAATESERMPACESASCGGIRTYSSHSSCPGEPAQKTSHIINLYSR